MIKSQDELNTCNDGKRGSEVLLATIEKCEALEKENEKLRSLLKECKDEFARINCGYDVCSGDFEDIIDKIKANIGESEE